MAKKYIKSHSNYILKANPIATQKGYVYENDLLTTSQKYNDVNNNMLISTDGGFTFIVNTTPTDKKTYNTDGWSEKQYTLSNVNLSVADFSRSNNSDTKTLVNQKKYVDLVRSYSKINDYCYFGSLNAMLKGDIDDIINRFPAGLSIDDYSSVTIVGGNQLVIPLINIRNPFGIDLFNYPTNGVILAYNLRTFASSFNDFDVFINEDSIATVTGFTSDINNLTLYLNKSVILNNSLFINPNLSKQNEFFTSLDDFQNVLLNQNTIPKYISYFEIPTEGPNGIEYYFKKFIWETIDGYNLDIETSNYTSFLSDLVDASNLSDEIYCDNLYRMLTHDTIKNLDSTYSRIDDEMALEEILIGGTKVQNVLRLYGRSFDELKKYIEGTSFVNAITYDGKNNLPIEYLSNRLDTSGFDVFSLSGGIPQETNTDSNIFPNSNKIYNTKDVNDEILKRLVISSKHIFRSKGTKKSLRKILGLLGVDENWCDVREYVQEIDNFITGSSLENIARLNYNIYPLNTSISDGKPEYEYSFDETLFENTNVGVFIKCPYCDSENYTIDSETGLSGTCIENQHVFLLTDAMIGYPKPLTNSTDYYFQQKGNWYRETGGEHTDLSGNTSYVSDISYGNNPHIGDGVYDNGYDYIDQFGNIFKRYLRNTETNIISGYTGIGFDVSDKKTIDNIKIHYNSDKVVSDEATKTERLKLNVKNIVVGLDGIKMLDSYFYRNNSIENITLNVINNNFNLTGSPEYLIIDNQTNNSNYNVSGVTSTLKIKSSSDSSFPVSIICSGSTHTLNQGELCKVTYTSGVLSISKYNGEDEFNTIKTISLPYLEQMVPSTAIFDFMLIDKDKPKWLLVDKYCGNYDGMTILKYKDINYFDETSTGVTSELISQIEMDFGTGFTYSGTTTPGMIGFERELLFIGDNGECPRDITPDWILIENMFCANDPSMDWVLVDDVFCQTPLVCNLGIGLGITPANGSNPDGHITASVYDGVEPYSYLWSDGQTTQTATGLTSGITYSVTATDSVGCTTSTYVEMTSQEVPL